MVHIVCYVSSVDSCSVDLGIILSFSSLGINSFTFLICDVFCLCSGISWENFSFMWDIDTSISSSFKCSENSVTGGSSCDTNIKKSLEWSLVLDIVIDVEVLSVYVGVWCVNFCETYLFKKSSGEKKSSGVGSGVVSQTSSQTESL